MILGYGQSEFGTMTMFNSDIPYRTNESGILIPEVKAKILDLVTGEPVEKGKRGELYIQTPACMKEYLNNPEATSKFFVFDENGERWSRTGDIAAIIGEYNGKDVYEVSGRKNDSFIDSEGQVVYLFDIEKDVEDLDFVKEAEVVSSEVNGVKVPVVHIIIEENSNITPELALQYVNDALKLKYNNTCYMPYAYKVRNKFSTSPISGKRNYAILQYETDGFYRVDENNTLQSVSLNKEEKVKKRVLK